MLQTFEEWISFIFDETDSDADGSIAGENPTDRDAKYVQYLTKLFENCGTILAQYTDIQVDTGLKSLIWEKTGWMGVIGEGKVELAQRIRCVKSMLTLFTDCFAMRCSQHLARNRPQSDPNFSWLNSLCWVWFDIIPIHGRPDDPTRSEIDQEFINLVEQICLIPHVACKESALYGIFTWAIYYPDKLEPILDRFFELNTDGSPELIAYAERVRTGYC